MEDAVLYRLPFDSTCLLFFSIHAYGWHSDTRAMFFSPRCWTQYRKSLFCVPTHTPEYDHLNYIFIELQKLTCIFLLLSGVGNIKRIFLWHRHPEGVFDLSSLLVVTTRMWCPFVCFQKHFQTNLISFLFQSWSASSTWACLGRKTNECYPPCWRRLQGVLEEEEAHPCYVLRTMWVNTSPYVDGFYKHYSLCNPELIPLLSPHF